MTHYFVHNHQGFAYTSGTGCVLSQGCWKMNADGRTAFLHSSINIRNRVEFVRIRGVIKTYV